MKIDFDYNCPLAGRKKCETDDCAWWDGEFERCGFMSIMVFLEDIKKYIKRS